MEKPIYQFADVELDTAKRQLRAGQRKLEVSPLVFAAIEHLAKHANQVVSKDELSDVLWPDRIVTEASITQTIRKARAALEDCGVDSAIIKTRHGHGYRLDAEVSIKRAYAAKGKRREHPFRTGAMVAVIGGVLVTAANLTDIVNWLLPDESTKLLEETQSAVQSTDAKVDELVRLLRDQAARAGTELDLDSENTIRDALAVIVSSVDARKQSALDQLVEGDVAGAASSIVAVAQDLDMASEQSVDAAAASWREAGAIYYTTNIDEAVRSYESAYRLRPDEPLNGLDLAFTYVRAGRLDDALELFERVAGSDVPADIGAVALRGAGTVHKLKGEYDAAAAILARAMDAAEEAGNRRQRGLVLLQQGAIARAQGDNIRAREQFEAAVSYAEEAGDPHFLAASLNNLGIVMAVSGDHGPAVLTLTKAYHIHTDRHDLAGQAAALGNLGATALSQGDLQTAESHLIDSVAIGKRLGWRRSIALDLINLGSIAASRQQFDTATEYLSEALDIAVSDQLNEIHPIILTNMGELARDRNDHPEACRLWSEAMPLLEAMQHNAVDIVARHQEALRCP